MTILLFVRLHTQNGQIILLGTVATKADSDVAFIQCNSVRGAFKVFNLLQVRNENKGA